MSRSGLTCAELVELVTSYLEDALVPEDRARFEEHLRGCEGCRTYLEQMRTTIEVTGQLAAESIPLAVRDELLEVFRTWHQG